MTMDLMEELFNDLLSDRTPICPLGVTEGEIVCYGNVKQSPSLGIHVPENMRTYINFFVPQHLMQCRDCNTVYKIFEQSSREVEASPETALEKLEGRKYLQ